MAKHSKKLGPLKALVMIILGLAVFGVFISALVEGFDIRLFNPKGPIAGAQLNLIKLSVAVLLLIAVPSVLLLYFYAWKYRETNKKATYAPGAPHGKFFVFSIWVIPSIFMLFLAFVMVPATHKLLPKKPIESNVKPLTIKVVALRWKWLFIYPEQNIATVNFVQVPVGTPVKFELTADETPMSSFWIPNLGGQLYAMTGHVTTLNLMADKPGDYPGSSAEINGAGFAGMKFITRASTQEQFDQWLQTTRLSSGGLDAIEYEKLLKPSQNNQAAFYSTFNNDIYDKLLMKYNATKGHQTAAQEGGKK